VNVLIDLLKDARGMT